MSKMIFQIILSIFIIVQKSRGQILHCRYLNEVTYTCKLDVLLAENRMNSTKVSGEHLNDQSDDEVTIVKAIFGSYSFFFPSIICEKFKNLKVLDLKDLGIQFLQNNSFDDCTNLEKLMINIVINTELPDNLFNANTKMSSVMIVGSSLQSLSKNLFKSQEKSLKDLEIQLNNVNCLIPWNFFQSLSNLQYLVIAIKGLKTLDPDWFKTLSKLEELAIVQSEILNLPKYVFTNLENLRKLSLRINKLTVIHLDSFASLVNLNYLDLSDNKIYSMDPDIFKLKKLRFVNFSNNFCRQNSVIDSSYDINSMPYLTNQCTHNFTLQSKV
ncbi:unnamed protein product [Chironomus riparius]|uniref:Uncharacterized protein n=1 Tax=Chironomus riparius TaxID=315576 RepID=A0A9N9S4U9_9DIPT|nr:unnamed protein product [Chironomus riparius]